VILTFGVLSEEKCVSSASSSLSSELLVSEESLEEDEEEDDEDEEEDFDFGFAASVVDVGWSVFFGAGLAGTTEGIVVKVVAVVVVVVVVVDVEVACVVFTVASAVVDDVTVEV